MFKLFGFYLLPRKAKTVLVLFVTMALLTSGVLCVHAYSSLKPIYEVKTNDKVLALTFDISWGNQTPMPVIEILKQENLKCTFFLSGPWAKQYPEVVQRIKEDGHEIASHGYRHINLSNLSKDEIIEEIMKAHQSIKEVSGVEPNLIRTPNGDYNNTVINAVHEAKYEAIQWSTDSLDWMNPGVNTIVERVSKKAHPGDIILMHASDTCKQTTEALPTVISQLKAQGYKFVTVSELLKLNQKQP